MANVVGGFLVSHCPLMFTAPEAAPVAQKERVVSAFAEVAMRIGKLEATTAIIIGADHYILFSPSCLPAMHITIGDCDGPIDRLPGLERGPIANNQALARHLFECGRDNGFDWAVAKAITVDHAISIPQQLCVRPNEGVKTIPVYLNAGVEPTISLRRARQLGALIHSAISQWPGDERVVVIGSGGISHSVGAADMGTVNEAFDREILARIDAGDLDWFTDLDEDYLPKYGGNGANEVRNFVCAMAAMGKFTGRTIAYEAIPEWITGLGFAELHPMHDEHAEYQAT